MTHIIKAKIENILGVKTVELVPNGDSLTIGGKNGQGKTSTIWALVMALAGKSEIPIKPVHDGAEKGEIVIDLTDMRVRLRVSADRSSSLTVENMEGAQYKGPQKLLDKLFSGLSFDPGSFKNMGPKDQRATLVTLTKLDLTDLESEREMIAGEKQGADRDVKRIEAQINNRTVDPLLPEELLKADDILQEIKKISDRKNLVLESLNDAKNSALKNKHALERVDAKREEVRKAINEIETAILNLQKRLPPLQEYLQKSLQEVDQINTHQDFLDKEVGRLEAEAQEVPDTTELSKKLSEVETTNTKIRVNHELKALHRELQMFTASREDYNTQLKDIETKKKERLAEIEYPIEGLEFSEDGVLYHGTPLNQCSESQQWEVSTAIGFALNPKGIVFMRASGGLDKDSRERVRMRAKELGVQLFLEVVDDADDVQILIENGEVKEDRTVTQQSA